MKMFKIALSDLFCHCFTKRLFRFCKCLLPHFRQFEILSPIGRQRIRLSFRFLIFICLDPDPFVIPDLSRIFLQNKRTEIIFLMTQINTSL